MDLGFHRAGMTIALETDNDPFCIETLKANGLCTSVMAADLFRVNGNLLLREAGLCKGDVDVVFGGPSCQPFSRSNEGRRRGIKDPTGRLIFEFSRVVKALKTHATAKDAIGRLDEGVNRKGGEAIGGMYGHLMDRIPPGMNYLYYTRRHNPKKPLFRWRSKFWTFLLKMDPSRPSHTIQANPGPYVGPFHWRNRRLTLEEIERLQGLPPHWRVLGRTKPEYTSAAWRQVGNAVPPKLAEAVAAKIREYL